MKTEANAAAAEIARAELGFVTLEERGCDRLDFRDVACSSVKAALVSAYEAGAANGTIARQEIFMRWAGHVANCEAGHVHEHTRERRDCWTTALYALLLPGAGT